MDLVIVAGMQRIEHYEIAAYGTDIALAKALSEQEVVDLLTATLEEEKQTDIKLTQVTEQHIMPAAMEGEEEGRGGRDPPAARKKPLPERRHGHERNQRFRIVFSAERQRFTMKQAVRFGPADHSRLRRS